MSRRPRHPGYLNVTCSWLAAFGIFMAAVGILVAHAVHPEIGRAPPITLELGDGE